MRLASLCAALGLLLGACGDDADQGGAAPPAIEVASLTDESVPQSVVQHCHAGLEGMDRIAARVTLADGTVLQAFARLPERLRTQQHGNVVQLWAGGRALQLCDGKAMPLDRDAAVRLQALATLLDAAALGPLRRAARCERTGARTFRLVQASGEPWELTLREGALLVERLRGPGGEVEVLDHLRTTTTWIVRRARIGPLGVCELRFERHDVNWDEAMFAPPEERRDGPRAAPPLRHGAEPRPETPQLVQEPAMRWLLLEDPGRWEERAALVRQHVAVLRANGQELKGFAGLLRAGGRDLLVVPFASQDDTTFAPPADWIVDDVPARRVMLVFPPSGDLELKIAAGTALLRGALAAQGLAAAGPILAQPYFHLDEGPPAAEKLAAPVVRMTVPVR